MSVKRECDATEDLDAERACSRVSDEEVDHEGGTRKKLRLSKEQSALLEESFKENSSLNPVSQSKIMDYHLHFICPNIFALRSCNFFLQKQKQALAKRLNLHPRQVELWFQNRRARLVHTLD